MKIYPNVSYSCACGRELLRQDHGQLWCNVCNITCERPDGIEVAYVEGKTLHCAAADEVLIRSGHPIITELTQKVVGPS